MLQSELFSKTKKENPRDEEAVNARLLIRAGFIDKLMAGVYTFLPLGLRVFKKIENIIREEMVAVGGQEILMPALQPKTNWEKTGRWDTLDSLIRFQSYYSKNDYALGPTHEEIVAPLLKKFISSYKDLPVYVFQIQNKFRDEARAKSGLLRGREFFMKDFYSFHRDAEDLDRFYEKMKSAYLKVFRRVGIAKKTYLTFASGGTFSKYSHEFQTLTAAGEDIIYICSRCKVAVNREIMKIDEDINQQNFGQDNYNDYISACPECGNKKFSQEKSVEVGNIFKLQLKYSLPFDLKFRDENGILRDIYMGCYGIGLNRLLGTIVEIFHDEEGIIWPESVAPFLVHLLDLRQGNDKIDKNRSFKIYQTLQKSGVEVLYDNRKELGAGEKFADADLIGIPWRVVIGARSGAKVELKKRSEKRVRLLTLKELISFFKVILAKSS
jgi:prolyl-tRNA synthetase